ncbi:early nodulin-like protein 7 [Prunus dulcis]|uniref:Early nodulin-like protein 7 n=1 Tax=Prunus dulcis TaxID=3755 RepID=A0A5H2XP06_PRUDU|nr:early nodulin-like protein 7 [Prunus dulcis]
MAKMPLTKQFVLFPFCPSSLAERVWFAETGLGFSSFPTSWLGGSHGRAVSVGRDVLEAVDFWLGGELRIQPQILRLRLLSLFYIFRLRLLSSLVTNLCIVALQYESQLGSHPIASGELGYEIQIREAVVRPNCLTILRFKESRPLSKRRKVMKKLQNKAQRIKQPSFVPVFAPPPSLRGFRPLRQNPVFVSCKSSRAFSLRVTDLGSGDFIFSTAFDWLPSFLLANICILCLQLEYTKKQGTGDLHFAAIFKLGYTKKQGTKHLDTTIIFEVLAIILLLHTISLSHVQTETESEKMVTTKSMEEIVSDSDLPIIGLKKKSSMENLPTSTPSPKIEVKTSVKEKKNHEESAKQSSPIK